MQTVQLTREGFDKLQKEQKELVDKKRPYAIDRLQKARGMGDLSENSEYTAAKEELALVEGRIQEIEAILKNVQVIENHNHGSVVSLSSKVTFETNGQRVEYEIVGDYEADPMNRKLSHTSPLGKALIGKKTGDTVTVDAPDGMIAYKILEVK